LPDLKFRSDLFYRLSPSPPDRFYRLSSSVSEDAGHENLKFRSPLLICEPRNICARVIILRQRNGQDDWRDQRCAWACQVYIPLYVHTLAFFNGLSTLMSSVALSFRGRCGKAGAVEIQAPYSGARRAQRIYQARPKPRRASSFCCGVGPRGVERPPNACFEGTTVNTF
jgi:hypothetical protein